MDQIAEVAKTLSHDDLLEVSKSSLQTFLSSDSLLSDLPPDILLEEINSLVRYIILNLFLRCSVVVDCKLQCKTSVHFYVKNDCCVVTFIRNKFYWFSQTAFET